MFISGLAGDAESENVYRTQMENWLEVACGSTNVVQVTALCDSPDELRAASAPKLRILSNDRKSLLSVKESLPSNTTNLVVVAWGHGGNQREVPVLHVRGPRIAPADFKTLAEKMPGSQWILIFRGSGGFARELAMTGARVISSDAGQSFTSDPVGMSLLLKLARSPAADSFDALAHEYGQAVASWYAERSLARTEEPALWAGASQKAELLATGSERNAGSRVRGTENARADVTENERERNGPGKSADSSSSTSESAQEQGNWKIEKIDPAAYPDFDAVVLRQRLRFNLGSNPALTSEQEDFIQVLTPEGKTTGDFDVSYAPPHEELEFLDCEVLRPDGSVLRLNPDQIGEAREQPLGNFQAQRRKFFSLPGVVPGAVVHVRYRTQWKQFPLPYVSMALPISKEVPALRSEIEISVPRQSAFHWAFEGTPPVDPVFRQSTYASAYTWTFTNLPAHRKEALSSPASHPRLLFSTFPDWKAFAGWYERISRMTGEVTPEIKTKAKELTAGAKSDREKLIALYNYITSLRYVAVPLGVNSVRPHAAANVLQNQFGDCKDKANLLNALLRSLDMEAHLVLVPRFSQAHDAVPGLAFNHAISRVTLGSEHLWLDTTDDVCRFGMLPPGDYGRKVLVIDGRTTTLTELPSAHPKDHRVEIKGELTLQAGSNVAPAVFQVETSGFPDYALRTAARSSREHVSGRPLLAADYRPSAGAFALHRQRSTVVSALDVDFAWEADGAVLGAVSSSGSQMTLVAPFWLPREWDLALHRRSSPLFLNQGYPLVLGQELIVRLPQHAKEVKLPRPASNDQGPLRWSVRWARVSDESLSAHLTVELETGELQPAQTGAFQGQLEALIGAVSDPAYVAVQTL